MAIAIGMPRTDASRVHPFFISKDRVAEDEIDPNISRRKRQKSTSPAPDPKLPHERPLDESWIDQLNVAAKEAPFPSTVLAESTRGDVEPSTSTCSQKSPNKVLTSGPENAADTIVAHGLNIPLNDNPQNAKITHKPSPPKKMLRIRADGKLSSPKSDLPGIGMRTRRPRHSKEQTEYDVSGIVIIKYGKRKKARRLLGERFNAILSGSARTQEVEVRLSTKTEQNANEVPKPTHPFFTGEEIPKRGGVGAWESDEKSHPPISTHPFFTGGASKKPLNPTRSGLSTNCRGTDDGKLSAPKFQSPKCMRVNSKPPNVLGIGKPKFTDPVPSFGTDHARMTRFPGAQDVIFPPAGMVHVGYAGVGSSETSSSFTNQYDPRKQKEALVSISAEEDVLAPSIAATRSPSLPQEARSSIYVSKPGGFRRPKRLVMSGRDLQAAIRSKLVHALPEHPSDLDGQPGELGHGILSSYAAPAALRRIFDKIAEGRSAFDSFSCEHQDWVHKYAPHSAEDVLQDGSDAILIRNWLQSLTVSSVTMPSSTKSIDKRLKASRRKRKRMEGLGDFLASSDEETAGLSAFSDVDDDQHGPNAARRTILRGHGQAVAKSGDKAAYAAILSGPNGCGKSAAVYAISRELGFEVFEINAGNRRSGKDILDKVGDMTHNHLVRNEPRYESGVIEEPAESFDYNERLLEDLESGRQRTMGSFFQAKGSPKRAKPKKPIPTPQPQHAVDIAPIRKPPNQKQSLILLEEVDLLFEEDKTFWTTVLDMVASTRRPIIMTCTDESRLPVDELPLHGMFRFAPARSSLAIDYLLLVACSEGHLLPRAAVAALHEAKCQDLRASMTELQFFCQMAVGDRKGGLDWMLLDLPAHVQEHMTRIPLRVVSENTYHKGMGWLGGDFIDNATLEQDTDSLMTACSEWHLNIEAIASQFTSTASSCGEDVRATRLNQLKLIECSSEARSSADLLPTAELHMAAQLPLDPSQPGISEKHRCNFTEGFPLLQADVLEDQTSLTCTLAMTLHSLAARVSGTEIDSSRLSSQQSVVQDIISSSRISNIIKPLHAREVMAFAFDPLEYSSKGPHISAFNAPSSAVAEDLAPYVRSIADYDLRLEEQREQLSAALSQSGRESGKMRKTRASRAALEGGNKANTRRERWFPKGAKYDWIMRTGGEHWQKAVQALQVASEITYESEEMETDKGVQRMLQEDAATDELQ